MQMDCDNREVDYAGFWVRLAAFLIDQTIAGAGLLIIRLCMNGVMSLLTGTALGGRLLFSFSLKDIVIYFCGALYFILCTYHTGTTPGKRLMNLRVISANGDEKLPLANVIYRETVGRFLSGFLLAIGYWFVALDREKRGLHDILGDTRVIYAKKIKQYPKYQAPRPYQPIRPDSLIYPQPPREAGEPEPTGTNHINRTED